MRTPRLGFQLYSIAGAKANTSLEPKFNRMLGGFCTLLGSRALYPVTLVLPLWRYVASSASTQLRLRLYSPASSAEKEPPGFALPRKTAPVPSTPAPSPFTLFVKSSHMFNTLSHT